MHGQYTKYPFESIAITALSSASFTAKTEENIKYMK